jgi:RHS repeat-associated protein
LSAEAYEYDSNGSRVQATASGGTVTGVVDAQDRLISYGGVTYEYTRNGELLRRMVGSDTTLYTYDARGALRSVQSPDGTTITYVIDAEGRRVGKRVNGVLTKAWLYQSKLAIAAELNANGAVVSRFVYGEHSSVPEYMVRSGATYRFLTDHQGTVRLVVNVATGVIAQRLDYDAFGRVIQNSNPGFQPFGFAGGLYDEQTGLVRFGARDYDAETGRWTTIDPLLFGGGESNLYAYVFADPVNLRDPLGLEGVIQTLQSMAGQTIVRGIRSPVKFARAVLKETGCIVLEEVVGEAVTQGVIYLATIGLGDPLSKAGLNYVGRTIGEVSDRLRGHHRVLDQILGLVAPGKGISLADLEASILERVARDIDPNRGTRDAIVDRLVGNRRRPGGGTPIDFCH